MKPIIVAALCLVPMAASGQSAEELDLIKAVFTDLNPVSIAENVEYCGYIGLDSSGNLVASPPTRGDEASCLADDPVNIAVITTSYHTHGAYSPDYYNELPSGDDMEGDEAEGVDGWVATPGVRLWYNDIADMVTYQVCGLGCLPADPDFVPGDLGIIAESYVYDELIVKLEE